MMITQWERVGSPSENRALYARRKSPKPPKVMPENTSLGEEMLGRWLTKASTQAIFSMMNGKYGAGSPMRFKTLVLKYGSPELLHKNIKEVKMEDILALPRTGGTLWKIFVEARDYKLR
jgi:hypothetical protein